MAVSAIDVGSGSTTFNGNANTAYGNVTYIDANNPANATGIITKLYIGYKNYSAGLWVNTYQRNTPLGTTADFTPRNPGGYEIGPQAAVGVVMYTGVHLEITSGDYIGFYAFSNYSIDIFTENADGMYVRMGVYAVRVTYTFWDLYPTAKLAIYGYGWTKPANPTNVTLTESRDPPVLQWTNSVDTDTMSIWLEGATSPMAVLQNQNTWTHEGAPWPVIAPGTLTVYADFAGDMYLRNVNWSLDNGAVQTYNLHSVVSKDGSYIWSTGVTKLGRIFIGTVNRTVQALINGEWVNVSYGSADTERSIETKLPGYISGYLKASDFKWDGIDLDVSSINAVVGANTTFRLQFSVTLQPNVEQPKYTLGYAPNRIIGKPSVIFQRGFYNNDKPAPLIHWKGGDNQASTKVQDYYNICNGTAYNITSNMSVPGKVGLCFQFGEGGNYFNSNEDINLKENFTIAFWMSATSLITGYAMFQGWAVDNHGLHIGANYNTGKFRFGFWNNDLDSITSVDTSGAWHHYAVTWNPADRRRSIYIDGVLNASDISPSPYQGFGKLCVGRIPYTDLYFEGKLDDIRIYLETLNESDIQFIYNNGDGTESSEESYYNVSNYLGLGQCAVFESGEYIQVNTPFKIDQVLTRWTVEALVCPVNVAHNSRLSVVGGEFEIGFDKDTGILTLYLGINSVDLEINGCEWEEKWFHFAVTGLGVGSITPYLNGVSLGVISPGPLTNDLTLSRLCGGSVANTNIGKIAEVRVWSNVKSATQIQDNMYKRIDPSDSELLAYFPLNGDLIDHSLSARPTTVVGSPTFEEIDQVHFEANLKDSLPDKPSDGKSYNYRAVLHAKGAGFALSNVVKGSKVARSRSFINIT